MSTLEVSAGLDAAELTARNRFVEHEFGATPNEADDELDRALAPLPRFLTARLGEDVAGSAFSFLLPLHLPGTDSTALSAAVSGVAVRADLRRRGVLTALMERQLADAHSRGEQLGCLWASESAIYGRFGYGMAAANMSLTVPRGAALQRVPTYQGRLSLVPLTEALPGLTRVHAACARPGFLVRDEPFWALRTHDPEHRRKGGAPLRCLIAGDPATPDGYALHSVTGEWAPTGARGMVTVRELLARDPGAHTALWAWLTTLDLTRSVRAEHLPVDEPLLTLLANPRSAAATWGDGLHVRLIDLPAALCARGWATSVDVVLEVSDHSCPWNAGRWHLAAGPDGACCTRSSAAPDLRCDVADLGAIYLGGPSLTQLAAAGRVVECTAGGVRMLSRAARGDIAPWSPMVF